MLDPNIGLAILAALNPRFPVAQAAQVLEVSPRPTFAFLLGTFGSHWANIDELIERIEVRNKKIRRISVYLDCGPCRRPRRSGRLNHICPSMTISQMNRALGQKGRGRKRLLKEFGRRTRRLIKFAQHYPHIEWRIYPVLEDNLTGQGFRVIYNHISDILEPSGIRFTVGRNRLGSPEGGWPFEVHDLSLINILGPGDAWSGDGIMHDPTVAQVKAILDRGADVLLWRPEWQGLVEGQETRASERDYVIRDILQLRGIINKATNK